MYKDPTLVNLNYVVVFVNLSLFKYQEIKRKR